MKKKSRSVTIQLLENPRSKNNKSRSDTIQLLEKPRSARSPEIPRSVKIPIPETEESRSGKEVSTRHPKNCLYINSGTFINILFNKELLGGLVNLDRPLKIQAGGKPINLSQIGSLHQA